MATPDKLGRPKKSGKKSTPKGVPRGTKIPLPNGGFFIAGAGNGPPKGSGGRPPDEWRAKLREMASRDEVLAHVQTVLEAGPEHPYFDRALQYVTDHGYGKPKQEIEHGGKVTLEHLLARSHELP
jgi:hypothetical protein